MVYQSYMHPVECLQGQAGADGYVVAWDAETGRERWRFNTAPIESSPLLRNNALYVGSWDGNVYSINARTGKKVWRFQADDEVNTSAAYWKGRIYIASRRRHPVRAERGQRQAAVERPVELDFGSREFWYATPTVAYGRVYIGNTDGTMYVYGAKSGKLLWARPLGSYIYGAAAVYQRKVFVGTYDGKFYALDAATGDTKWQIDARRHGARRAHRDGRPRVLRDLLHLRLGGPAGGGAAGPTPPIAVRARDGKRVWRFAAGKYANPVVADRERIYLTGRSLQFALAPRGRRRARGRPRRAHSSRQAQEEAAPSDYPAAPNISSHFLIQ